MSLVNDMLRDLEARGAASGGQSPFLDMQAVDETAATRRQRSARLRRWLLPLAVGALVAAASVVLFERFAQAPAVQEPPAAAPVVAAVPAQRPLARRARLRSGGAHARGRPAAPTGLRWRPRSWSLHLTRREVLR